MVVKQVLDLSTSGALLVCSFKLIVGVISIAIGASVVVGTTGVQTGGCCLPPANAGCSNLATITEAIAIDKETGFCILSQARADELKCPAAAKFQSANCSVPEGDRSSCDFTLGNALTIAVACCMIVGGSSLVIFAPIIWFKRKRALFYISNFMFLLVSIVTAIFATIVLKKIFLQAYSLGPLERCTFYFDGTCYKYEDVNFLNDTTSQNASTRCPWGPQSGPAQVMNYYIGLGAIKRPAIGAGVIAYMGIILGIVYLVHEGEARWACCPRLFDKLFVSPATTQDAGYAGFSPATATTATTSRATKNTAFHLQADEERGREERERKKDEEGRGGAVVASSTQDPTEWFTQVSSKAAEDTFI